MTEKYRSRPDTPGATTGGHTGVKFYPNAITNEHAAAEAGVPPRFVTDLVLAGVIFGMRDPSSGYAGGGRVSRAAIPIIQKMYTEAHR